MDLDKANHGCRWAAYCTREAITEGMEVFYDTVARLFAGGRLGGCVVTAQGRWSDRELAEAELQSLE